MAIFTLRDIMVGRTTLDAMWTRALDNPGRPLWRGRYISIPSPDPPEAASTGIDPTLSRRSAREMPVHRVILPIMSDDRLYDLGYCENWNRFKSRQLFPRTEISPQER